MRRSSWACDLTVVSYCVNTTFFDVNTEWYVAWLSQVMELREEVAEVAGEETVRALLAENAKRQRTWERKILQAFAADQLNEAQRLVSEMAYWDRIEEQLKEKL